MRSESGDQSFLELSKTDDDDIPEFHKKTKILYTRNYLLSLSRLDTCKRLPSGLDRSILGGLCDSWTGTHPCHSSDSDRSHGYLSRRCLNSKDGLLGSGEASPPVVKDNVHHLLNKSNSAYQPPHRFKALAKVRSRTESEDLCNNETFGPSEHPGLEREEEERRRRDSFELMRKEQRRTFQEKQNKELHEHKENWDPEMAKTLEASGSYKKYVNQNNESKECAESVSPSGNSTGQDFTKQTSASGNLLPPVLESRTCKMNFRTESLIHTFISEPCDGIIHQTKDHRFQTSDFCHQFLGGSPKYSRKTDFPGTRADSVGMFTRNDWLKPQRFPIPAASSNAITPPTVDESGSIEIHREGIIPKGCAKQTVVSETEDSLSIFEDINKLVGFGLVSELESKTSPVNAFHESADSTDEICLPEEDTLITVDDFIIPQDDSTFVADRGSAKADLSTFNSQVDIADKLEALNLSHSDQISTQFALDGPIFDSYDVMGLKTSYQHLHTQQSLPQFGRYQMNPGRALFKSSHTQEVQKSFNTKSFASETYLYNGQPLHHHFPTNVFTNHTQNPHADLRKFGPPINSPLLRQMPVPSSNSSLHQVHGLLRTLPSPHPLNKLTCYTQELRHPTQTYPSCYKQQHYRRLEIPTADHIDGGISDKAFLNRQFEMEDQSRQIHSPSMARHAAQESLANMRTTDLGLTNRQFGSTYML